MRRMKRWIRAGVRRVGRLPAWLLPVVLVLLLVSPAVTSAEGAGSRTVRLQLLAINDFHGALQSRTLGGRPIGGAAVLAAYWDRWEEEAKKDGFTTLRVGVGDLVGASPPVSALLQDEPTIEALNRMHLLVSAVGNHEFDEGVAELRRLQEGGCHPVTGCFEGAKFQYLTANVVDAKTGEPLFPPYAIVRVRGIPVGFIGVTLKETPTIVTPTGVAGVRFLDEAESVNRYVAELKRQRVETIIVLLHQGGDGDRRGGPISGAIVPIVEAMDDEVDVVLSGHTHRGYWGIIDGKLVTQAYSSGTAFADVDLVLDGATGDVIDKRARIVDTYADVPPGTEPDKQIARLVARAKEQVEPIINRVVGTAADDITRQQTPAGESELGNLIADAQRWAMGTQVAFMNPGGIRADIAAGEVTWGELYEVQPFGNDLVKMTLTGAQIERLLEQQWLNQPYPRILQVSGLDYSWDPRRPVGDRVDPADIRIGGQPLDLNARYTITANSFLAAGGDNFSVFTEGQDRVVGPVDIDALVRYVEQLPQPFNARVEGRITLH
ncbi:bifunctional metallophosphatase/5'-nucleotidase [Thermaerobacter subterraneus]|uniref:5'-nucleotidase/2',3'-cyclic phosphodiesterase-like hydrolase n=1 Tax=Thermaerobacter subterraneus DSM 13965 TaxID=867903 RepID=K6PQG1_9FIRM|nr:bifunctional metallophosphatase/5'-nucleotidase [Thermaerobacter subterraneus]EKP95182.1 5'-nucleotidase/2',3'-cyclic phosphodiesterase-like hydrolase [Thermaerobacter subterraneus DSM 13965]